MVPNGTMLVTIATLLVGLIKERDKLRFDVRLNQLEWTNAQLVLEIERLKDVIARPSDRDVQQ